ncbi:Ribosomal protein S5 domain 2-type fold [Lasallia pustulata]|uniref:Ribosomal protein S5 domain 2-type fold n=1 Tax=Lasallia pustulata TaxID=136370 RepID=A0A1W5D8J3_9LECA|nr:Ribosomal protein S5 domain 2-type fold [Lasallia pustulata]
MLQLTVQFARETAMNPGRYVSAPFQIKITSVALSLIYFRVKVLKTGLTPSASGSAYYELEPSVTVNAGGKSLISSSSALKLICTVHGPRPLPRSTPFTPHILLSTHVKFAPFAARQRRGYLRDAGERDLAVHLETALRGVIIGDRWPKSGVEVIITVLEGEEDRWWGNGADQRATGGWGMMTILAGCITVASAAIVDAGIDCVDLVSGGVAAIVRESAEANREQQRRPVPNTKPSNTDLQLVIDPCPSEHRQMVAACVIGYLQSRDEITELWAKGDIHSPLSSRLSTQISFDDLVDRSIEAAVGTRMVLTEAVRECTELKTQRSKFSLKNHTSTEAKGSTEDMEVVT